MKPYETGICVCGKRREDHDETGTCDDLFQDGNGNYVPQCFLDSGTAHLCSEEVASGLLRELQKARELINKQHCTGKVSAKEELDVMSDIDKAINEALKR